MEAECEARSLVASVHLSSELVDAVDGRELTYATGRGSDRPRQFPLLATKLWSSLPGYKLLPKYVRLPFALSSVQNVLSRCYWTASQWNLRDLEASGLVVASSERYSP